MKKLYYFNKIILITTAIFYLTIILGLYAQIALGIIQILSAIGILVLWKNYDYNQKKHLKTYWLFVIIYGLRWLFFKESVDDIWLLDIIILPMTLAVYFVWILHKLKEITL
ncbi:hypothetical protein DZC78_13630 [Olleya aquimaris]|uniref:Transmembrane protein n=1 Tax=Olleya sediminilitoris TaxID=2795739 RepID=A0ABS1WMP4_9FLAO|nr:hypothetical protein [Olleya sediminilitoris]AXO81385.1 hypothetical protein DZC78_13630 [Olleya aquimaris]MBL7560389.1 hypothetical protein [Olleya sediminilitoris]